MDGLGRWAPLTPPAVASVFADLGSTPWWIAGGYAIELFVGRHVRTHGDIDVFLLRRHQHVVHDVLAGWDLQAADPPGTLRPWQKGETLQLPVHDVWCRRDATGPWEIQLMFEETSGDRWYSRRNPLVTMTLDRIGRRTPDGLPYVAPEVQLVYKATSSLKQPYDDIDFAAALPLLNPHARSWLDHALGIAAPDHPWRAALAARGEP